MLPRPSEGTLGTLWDHWTTSQRAKVSTVVGGVCGRSLDDCVFFVHLQLILMMRSQFSLR